MMINDLPLSPTVSSVWTESVSFNGVFPLDVLIVMMRFITPEEVTQAMGVCRSWRCSKTVNCPPNLKFWNKIISQTVNSRMGHEMTMNRIVVNKNLKNTSEELHEAYRYLLRYFFISKHATSIDQLSNKLRLSFYMILAISPIIFWVQLFIVGFSVTSNSLSKSVIYWCLPIAIYAAGCVFCLMVVVISELADIQWNSTEVQANYTVISELTTQERKRLMPLLTCVSSKLDLLFICGLLYGLAGSGILSALKYSSWDCSWLIVLSPLWVGMVFSLIVLLVSEYYLHKCSVYQTLRGLNLVSILHKEGHRSCSQRFINFFIVFSLLIFSVALLFSTSGVINFSISFLPLHFAFCSWIPVYPCRENESIIVSLRAFCILLCFFLVLLSVNFDFMSIPGYIIFSPVYCVPFAMIMCFYITRVTS